MSILYFLVNAHTHVLNMNSSDLTLTFSPKHFSDIDVLDIHKILYSDKNVHRSITAVHHGSDGSHPHLHIYVNLYNAVRSNNFRRKFVRCIRGGSDPIVALKIVNAYSLPHYLKYVLHEDDVTFSPGYNLTDCELQDAIGLSKELKDSKKNIERAKSLTMHNALFHMLKVFRELKLTKTDTPSRIKAILRLEEQGFTILPVLSKLNYVFDEVSIHLASTQTEKEQKAEMLLNNYDISRMFK